MTMFATRMKFFTDQLAASHRDRDEALAQLKDATETLCDEARGFVEGVVRERRAMADKLHHDLSTARAKRSANVEAMRQANRERLAETSASLRSSLSETRRTREEAVGTLNLKFSTARHELSDDLEAAANAWREFASKR